MHMAILDVMRFSIFWFHNDSLDGLHANTAPVSWTLKLYRVLKTSGIDENMRYNTAQLNDIQSEKKNTTGSVKSRSICISHA